MGSWRKARETVAAAEELQRQAREQRNAEREAAQAAEEIAKRAAERGRS